MQRKEKKTARSNANSVQRERISHITHGYTFLLVCVCVVFIVSSSFVHSREFFFLFFRSLRLFSKFSGFAFLNVETGSNCSNREGRTPVAFCF